MPTVARTALALLLLSCLAAPARGEERTIAPPAPIPAGKAAAPLLARWLAGGNDVEAAWAGWEVGERGLADLGPEVVLRLDRELRRQGEARRSLLHLVLMDAALRLAAEIPAETLRRYGFGAAAVVTYLCARKASALHVAAFLALDEGGGPGSEAWFALAGHLHAARSPALARRLLLRWKLERMLRVWDEDPPYRPYGRPFGSVPADGFAEVPDGYPPLPRRWLSRQPLDGWSQVVGGVFPVYGTRSVSRERRIGWGYIAGRHPTPDEARHAWLSDWLRTSRIPALPPWEVVDVKWSGGRRFWERQARGVVVAVHHRWRAWRDALLAQGLLTPAQCAGLAPTVTWTIRDERRLQRHPLPPFPEVLFEPRLPRHAAGVRR